MIDELKLLRGKSIPCGNLEIRPLTLGEIEEITEEKYNHMLSIIFIDKNKVFQNIDDKNISDYDVFLYLLIHDEQLYKIGMSALNLFTGRTFGLNENGVTYQNDDGSISTLTDEEFTRMREILTCQNYMGDPKKDKQFNPANKKAEELHKKLMERRKKAQEANKKDNEGLHLSDVISIVACYSEDVNLITIWDYSVYQLYEEYVRLQIWDEYHVVQSLLPHLDTEKNPIKTKHWGAKVSPNTLKEEN